jgi:hypothetical protein
MNVVRRSNYRVSVAFCSILLIGGPLFSCATEQPENEKHSIEENDDQQAVYLQLGQFWKDRNRPDEAIAAYEQALASKSPAVRGAAMRQLTTLIQDKTSWRRNYVREPLVALLHKRIELVVFILLVILALFVARVRLRRTDLLLVPNSTVPDVQWLTILIKHYVQQFNEIHGVLPIGWKLPLLIGSGGELVSNLMSQFGKIESSSLRYSLVKFLRRPRFELELSVQVNDQNSAIAAALTRERGPCQFFIVEFPTANLPSVQKDLGFWVASFLQQQHE